MPSSRRRRALPILTGEPSEPAATTGAALPGPEPEPADLEPVEPGGAVPRPADAAPRAQTATENRDRLLELLAARAARKEAQRDGRPHPGPKTRG